MIGRPSRELLPGSGMVGVWSEAHSESLAEAGSAEEVVFTPT